MLRSSSVLGACLFYFWVLVGKVMTTYAIKTDGDRQRVIKAIQSRGLPATVTINKGLPRSNEQNKLQRKWLKEAEEQGDQTAEEYRAYCKLHFGVPILRAENDEFREKYDRIIRPLPYVQKLEIMALPFDFPCSRLMTTRQHSQYLDAMYRHFSGLGILLTEPDQHEEDQNAGRQHKQRQSP